MLKIEHLTNIFAIRRYIFLRKEDVYNSLNVRTYAWLIFDLMTGNHWRKYECMYSITFLTNIMDQISPVLAHLKQYRKAMDKQASKSFKNKSAHHFCRIIYEFWRQASILKSANAIQKLMLVSAMVQTFPFSERWNGPLNGIFHLSPKANICSIARKTKHSLFVLYNL